jgi:hypothetical protein
VRLLLSVVLRKFFPQVSVAFGIKQPTHIHGGKADEKAGKKPEIEEGKTQDHRLNAIVHIEAEDKHGEGNSHHQEKGRKPGLHKSTPLG